MQKRVDFRSDTVTQPTETMRKAMYEAEVGDDVLQEDPTVNRLESAAAELLGKEAALLIPSGTFGNQLALFTHCTRGDEVVLSETSHIVEHEAGAASVLAAVQLRTVAPRGGRPVWDEIYPRIRTEKNIHFPATGCIALENALSSGECMPVGEAAAIYEKARKYSIPVHLDGARIFNAAAALNAAPEEIAAAADSVMFCLSKGLCAPVGSMLAGTGDFIEAARRKRKIMGGGMRQAGILAAAGIIAIEEMRLRLREDHETAARLKSLLSEYEEFEILGQDNPINMVFFSLTGRCTGGEARFLEACLKRGYLTYPPEDGRFRFVTHYGITEEDIESFGKHLPAIIEASVRGI